MEAADAAEAVEVLQGARDRLMTSGWWALTTRPELPGMVPGGQCATNTLHRELDARRHLWNRSFFFTFLEKAGGFQTVEDIQNWNDNEAQGINDVLALYDEAILLAKEAELAAPVSDSEPTT